MSREFDAGSGSRCLDREGAVTRIVPQAGQHAASGWVQSQILDTHPKANLRVYAIWFNMMGGDDRSKWPAALLTDLRVSHRWDEPKAVGTWYGQRAEAMRLGGHPKPAINRHRKTGH